MSYLELPGLTAPELILTITAFVVLAVDLLVMREEEVGNRCFIGGLFAVIGCMAAMTWLLVINVPTSSPLPQTDSFLRRMFSDDSFTRLVKITLLGLTVCCLLFSMAAKFTRHVGEYFSLVLFATIGMMLLVSSMDLLMIFISLELTSLSLYILTAFNKRNVRSVEAALKYFLFGGMAAAFTLFGLSFVYGLSNTTHLPEIAAKLASASPRNEPLLIIGLLMVLIGFGFKIAVAPFHLWAPDAYEGAPAPSAALIASGSKLAGFFILVKVMMLAFGSIHGDGTMGHFVKGWMPLLAVFAASSMLLGNLAAIAQTNLRRLVAYSAIAQAGYALLGILANDHNGVAAVFYYMTTYGMTVAGIFGIIDVIETNCGDAQIKNFAGLSRRSPWLAACMGIFLLSLAGIPPLAGFFGKFYLFTAVLGGSASLGWLWLVILAIAMSAVSLYYYLQVLKQMYVVSPPDGQLDPRVPKITFTVVLILAIGVVVTGCFPNLILDALGSALQSFGR